MKLSQNFSWGEFTNRDRHIFTSMQLHMVMCIANNILQPIRDFLTEHFKKNMPIVVRDGIRFPSDINRLRQKGNNPSETSDHLYGNVIKLSNAENIKRYGKYHCYSVGAADIVPMCGAKEAWEVLRPMFDTSKGIISLPSGPVKIGQMILERRYSYWIHISNPASLIYQDNVANEFLKKPYFLTSMDNGRSFTLVT